MQVLVSFYYSLCPVALCLRTKHMKNRLQELLNDFMRISLFPSVLLPKYLGGNVHYYDGTDADALRIVERMPHVMISRYPENAAKLSLEEAVNKAREQLIAAFEKKYGTYTPLEENVQVEQDDDEATLRRIIANLKVKMENDSYYVLPVVMVVIPND